MTNSNCDDIFEMLTTLLVSTEKWRIALMQECRTRLTMGVVAGQLGVCSAAKRSANPTTAAALPSAKEMKAVTEPETEGADASD